MQEIYYTKEIIKFMNINGIEKECTFYYVLMNDFSILKKLLEKYLVEIYAGDKKYNIKTVKQQLLHFLAKKTSNQQKGAVAEFFTHLFLIDMKFQQEFIFSNLEDNSFKKGFDGLFTKDNVFWLMESKSGNTIGVTHKKKINEAIEDITNKVEGKTPNNPFDNAVNHIRVVREDYNKTLYKTILDLSREYECGVFHSINEFNIIPVSTIFIDHGQSIEKIIIETKKLLGEKEFKDIIVICIDNSVFDSFIKYLEE